MAIDRMKTTYRMCLHPDETHRFHKSDTFQAFPHSQTNFQTFDFQLSTFDTHKPVFVSPTQFDEKYSNR